MTAFKAGLIQTNVSNEMAENAAFVRAQANWSSATMANPCSPIPTRNTESSLMIWLERQSRISMTTFSPVRTCG